MKADELMAIINGSNKKYYTYILSRPCGTPFYVGIGTGRRVLDHEIYARREAGHSRKLSIMRKIFRQGYSIHYFKIKGAIMNIENTVRSAALALQDAITAAKSQGYVIEWPSAPAGLSGLAISETSAVVETVTEAVPIVAADEATEVVSKPKK